MSSHRRSSKLTCSLKKRRKDLRSTGTWLTRRRRCVGQTSSATARSLPSSFPSRQAPALVCSPAPPARPRRLQRPTKPCLSSLPCLSHTDHPRARQLARNMTRASRCSQCLRSRKETRCSLESNRRRSLPIKTRSSSKKEQPWSCPVGCMTSIWTTSEALGDP